MASPYVYPNNVVPQVRSPKANSPGSCLSCPPDVSIMSIIFDQTSLAIVKGWETKSTTDLREFFQPVDSYMEYQVTLKPMLDSESVVVNYGMIGDEGGITFLAILPLWHLSDVEPDDIKLNWRYRGYALLRDANSNSVPDNLEPYGIIDDGYTTLNYNWDELGKILILSGTKAKPIRPIELQNKTTDSVILKILIGR